MGEPTVVGWLEYGISPYLGKRSIDNLLESTFLVGRNSQCHLSLSDATISNTHLRIYCVVFDKSDDSVKPLVYAEDVSSNGSYWNGTFMGKGNGGVLLSDGDELRLSPRITLTFRTSLQYDEDAVDRNIEVESRLFGHDYRVTRRKLGSGAHGNVYMALNLTQGTQVACKVVNLKKIRLDGKKNFRKFMASRDSDRDCKGTSEGLRQLSKQRIRKEIDIATSRAVREVEILQDISHPNIVRLEQMYQTNDQLFIFEELITGGDLFSYIEYRGGRLDEAEAGVITLQLSEALKYLHQRNIAHRDLKPDNVLVASLDRGARVVLTDFGHAIRLPPNDSELTRTSTLVGTLEYIAPEVYGANPTVKSKGYTKAIDMWSLGCVVTALLTGLTPFTLDNGAADRRIASSEVWKNASVCKLDELYKSTEWQDVTKRPRDFIGKLLVLDERHRMTAEEAVRHHWLTNDHVREAFDAVYSRITANWRCFRPAMNITQTPDKSTLSTGKHYPGAQRRQRAGKPIEPHLTPPHRRFYQMLSPRPQSQLQSIEQVTEEWHESLERSVNRLDTTRRSIEPEVSTVRDETERQVSKPRKFCLRNSEQGRQSRDSPSPYSRSERQRSLERSQRERSVREDTPSTERKRESRDFFEINVDEDLVEDPVILIPRKFRLPVCR